MHRLIERSFAFYVTIKQCLNNVLIKKLNSVLKIYHHNKQLIKTLWWLLWIFNVNIQNRSYSDATKWMRTKVNLVKIWIWFSFFLKTSVFFLMATYSFWLKATYDLVFLNGPAATSGIIESCPLRHCSSCYHGESTHELCPSNKLMLDALPSMWFAWEKHC